MSETRRKYDEEFKKRAVRMSYSSKRTVTQVAESLGISSKMKCASYVYGMLNWKRKTTY